ncbi:hypothetical protein CBS147333_3687 [Penicillium roqueforti]|nr:hypothetical protein CBS147354_8516 [Penicillium roqueforti]KAI3112713.1 hypothetical protein CBS147333_3687 [Penicillium roqueforti]KAI3128664.1 hypothetical protein CBS147326_6689 [Penicillium roqueforti]KAI3196702.1 hypothetical protein CBS147311_7306 [Penicillium roqueforti]KAI3224127.1 hypothetical protein CBS147310_9156 [Penicillium roqueforti]
MFTPSPASTGVMKIIRLDGSHSKFDSVTKETQALLEIGYPQSRAGTSSSLGSITDDHCGPDKSETDIDQRRIHQRSN